MSHIFRILCAVDFSRPAHAAFEQALALSRARQAELTVRQLATDAGVRFTRAS